jgi:hypothetical protein
VLVVAAVIAIGLYSVLIVGVTGGPNHGEHPLTATLVHLSCFLWLGRTWPAAPWWIYVGLLALALVASLVGFGSRAFDRSRGRSTARYAIAQGLLAAAYAGLVATLFWRHAYP